MVPRHYYRNRLFSIFMRVLESPSANPSARESGVLIMSQDGYANKHAPGGQVEVPPGPFLQSRIRLDGRKGSGFPLRRE